jgi:uncharacterized protein (TIGR00303 family)
LTAPQRISGSAAAASSWCDRWRAGWQDSQVLLLLAATATAEVPGISAAGATPSARRGTAAADAELLLLGPEGRRPHALPPLPAGVSPALISHVVLRDLALSPLVVDLGCPIAPAVCHLRLPDPAGSGPARCLSGGAALSPQRLATLLAWGRRWGARLPPGRPLLLAECVPGGTTTAQAVLRGLGVAADGLVSGSLRHPDHALKADLVARGLRAAGLVAADGAPAAAAGDPAAAGQVVAAVGDPMQPLAAALVVAATEVGRPLLLAGGSQMAAVLALALALAPQALRPRIAAGAAIGTTAWVAEETGSDLALLLRRIGDRWGVEPLGFAASLRFRKPCHQALGAYELGYVKEGVGAGGLALLWQLSGRSSAELANRCDQACQSLLGPSAPTFR